jgi:hypothetical protein
VLYAGHLYCYSSDIKVMMGHACSLDGRGKKFLQNFGRKTSW